MIHPESESCPPHKCPWGFRNPRNHLTLAEFKALLMNMADKDNQKITCPGCGREVYLEIKIPSHNKKDKLTAEERKEAKRSREQYLSQGLVLERKKRR
jgi:hypothetical protein